jgi:hypothetical protein
LSPARRRCDSRIKRVRPRCEERGEAVVARQGRQGRGVRGGRRLMRRAPPRRCCAALLRVMSDSDMGRCEAAFTRTRARARSATLPPETRKRLHCRGERRRMGNGGIESAIERERERESRRRGLTARCGARRQRAALRRPAVRGPARAAGPSQRQAAQLRPDRRRGLGRPRLVSPVGPEPPLRRCRRPLPIRASGPAMERGPGPVPLGARLRAARARSKCMRPSGAALLAAPLNVLRSGRAAGRARPDTPAVVNTLRIRR